MKAYIQSELVGDEDVVVIDCAILQCLLHEAIFDALTNAPVNGSSMDTVNSVMMEVLAPYVVPRVSFSITLERESNEGKTIRWVSE